MLQIRILEGEGVVNPAGSKSERALSVIITDETGRPVDGATVSFQLPEQGPSGAFETTDRRREDIVITAADGNAIFRGVRWNRVPGPFQIRLTAAKNGVRAGAICSQYISDAAPKKSSALRSGRGGRGKWIVLAGVIAGGAAAGMIVGRGSGSSNSGPGPSAPPATPVQIGSPTITIGRP